MRDLRRILGAAAVVFLGAASMTAGPAAPARAADVVYGEEAPMAPPPVRHETVPSPPGARERYAWDPGHWHWDGNGFVWTAGAWLPRPYAGAIRMPGLWVGHDRRWLFIVGHWAPA
jgi:hypothetical protein